MSYIIKNLLPNNQINCSLGDNSTLFIPIGGEEKIEEGQMTRHIKHLAEIGYAEIEKVGAENVVKAEAQQKRKGGKDDGDIIKT